MPIYEYRCSACGFQKEFLQRLNDKPHTTCPKCGKRTFDKQVTAAGFQLKGTGWYATDFRNSGGKPAAKKKDGDGAKETAGKDSGKDSGKESGKESSSTGSSSKESTSKESKSDSSSTTSSTS